LHKAITQGNLQQVENFLAQGADVNLKIGNKQALELARERGCSEIIADIEEALKRRSSSKGEESFVQRSRDLMGDSDSSVRSRSSSINSGSSEEDGGNLFSRAWSAINYLTGRDPKGKGKRGLNGR